MKVATPTILESDFIVKDERCSGSLYLPQGVVKPPVVIMAHGLAAEKSFKLPEFAERFVSAGFACFLFDYRTFGQSSGEPRNYVHPWRHVQDWQGALDHVQKIPEVDGNRVALWGSSFGGGHVLKTAASRPEVRAVISQVPFVDGIASLSLLSPGDLLKAMGAGLRDLFRILTFRAPYYVKVVAKKGQFAAMNTEESWDGYTNLIPEGSSWENKLAARLFLIGAFYSPLRAAHKIKSPVLLMGARYDSLIPFAAVQKTAARIPNCTLKVLDCNHFAPYYGEWFEENVRTETDFLRKHLLVSVL